MRSVKVLIADDEENLVRVLTAELGEAGFLVHTAKNGREAIKALGEKEFDVCLLDINMPYLNGIEVLRKASEQAIPTEFIMVTADSTVNTAIEAMKLGAYDYVMKPCSLERLVFLVKKAHEKRSMKREGLLLKRLKNSVDPIITKSPAMLNLLEEARKVAMTDCNVLILGESGTGKNLLAGFIHENSRRSNGTLISLNVAAIQTNLVESELFGYEKGAFTGAVSPKAGLFELADGGTVFLDEIGEISVDVQVKLLRVIEKGSFFKVGGTKEINVDVRVIAATNSDLVSSVKEKKFREDLYYRLSTVTFCIPPLRERREDIGPIAEGFLAGLPGAAKKALSPGALDILKRYDWPGNIRELKNAVYRASVLADSDEVGHENLPPEIKNGAGHAPARSAPMSDFTLKSAEKEHIRRALVHTGRHRKKTADILGIDSKTLYRKIKDYGLE